MPMDKKEDKMFISDTMSDYDDDFMGGDDEDYDLEYSGKDIPTPSGSPPPPPKKITSLLLCHVTSFAFFLSIIM